MIKLSVFLLLLMTLGIFNFIEAQSNKDVSKQIWIDVNPTYSGYSGLELLGDAGLRKEIENDGWMRIVLRPSVRIPIGKQLFFSAGLGNFITINEIISNRWEIRPFQGVSYTWPQGLIPLRHYVRLEERFDFNTTTWNSVSSIRGRYQLTVSHRWAAVQHDRYWQASAMGEAFYTFAGEQGQFQEQVRVTLGLDRSFRNNLHFRVEITWQQEKLFFDSNESVSDIYFRFRYTYRWGDK